MNLKLLIWSAALFILALAYGRPPVARIECAAGCADGGRGASPRLIEPFAVAFDRFGNWYICEYMGHRVSRVRPDGVHAVFAGTGIPGYSGDDGPAANASFKEPHGLIVGKNEQMYIADTHNHCVRKIDLSTGIITTFAGTGKQGYAGDGGPARQAQFNGVFAIAISPSGNALYIADLGNRRVRRVDLRSGIVQTVSGNGESGVPKNGADAVNSPLVDPRAVAVDADENVYVLERRGNALRVVDKGGMIGTLVGPESVRTRSDDPPLNGPKHLCMDGKGNVLIADTENHIIRKYTLAGGTLATIAGTGEKGSLLVSEDPLKTQLNRPHGVSIDRSGALFISDTDNHRVLKMSRW